MFGPVQIARRIEDEGGTGAPEGGMLEQRVAVLEADVGTIKGILERLEPKISEILLTGAKQADLHKTQLDVAELKGRITGLEDRFDGKFARFGGKLSGVDGKISGIEAKFSGLDAKFSGLDARIALLPSTWTILGIVFTTWALGSGILIFALTRILAK